jgi:hypothetical protein
MQNRMSISLVIFLVLFIVLTKNLLYAQDYNNPCFFCHMNVLVEMKSTATAHWENEVQCSACHGKSIDHIDVEDNSLPPDSIWTLLSVHELCSDCHQETCALYGNSPHAAYLKVSIDTNNINHPSCVTCHGAHTLKKSSEIETECLKCHNSLPDVCNIPNKESADIRDIISCTSCHSPHKMEIPNKTEKQ